MMGYKNTESVQYQIYFDDTNQFYDEGRGPKRYDTRDQALEMYDFWNAEGSPHSGRVRLLRVKVTTEYQTIRPVSTR